MQRTHSLESKFAGLLTKQVDHVNQIATLQWQVDELCNANSLTGDQDLQVDSYMHLLALVEHKLPMK